MSVKILFHSGCTDGFCAAWVTYRSVAHLAQNREYSPEMDVEIVPVRHGEPAPKFEGSPTVYVVDFSYSRAELLELLGRVESLTVLDHHKTARDALDGELKVDKVGSWKHARTVFDMERSGAGIAWDYFNDRASRPWIVSYVEDLDLWRFRLPMSREINAWIRALPHQLDVWERASRMEIGYAATCGAAVIAHERLYVEQTASMAVLGRMPWRETGDGSVEIAPLVPFVTCSFVMVSDVLDELAKRYPEAPYVVGWRVERDGKIVYSLRSRGAFDVSELAKKFGGGGHVQAAGFTVPKIVHTWEQK